MGIEKFNLLKKKLILHTTEGIGDNLLIMYDIYIKYQYIYDSIYILDDLGDYRKNFERYFNFNLKYNKDYSNIDSNILSKSRNIEKYCEMTNINDEYDSTTFNNIHTIKDMRIVLNALLNIIDLNIPNSILNSYKKDNINYNLKNRIGVHLRFRNKYISENIYKNNILNIVKTIQKSFKHSSLLLIYDNEELYNDISYLFEGRDVFILNDIDRSNNKEKELETDYLSINNTTSYEKLLYDSVKEAYYIAMCKKFYTQNSSLFGNLVIPLIKNYVNK